MILAIVQNRSVHVIVSYGIGETKIAKVKAGIVKDNAEQVRQ
jgi:hypothetical protein